MSKKIENYFELKDVCRSAGLWWIGSFMIEFLMQQEKWSNPETKNNFVKYMHENCGGTDKDESGTRTRVNCVIRIIESGMVEDALEMVLQANDEKIGCEESKVNAKHTLELLNSHKISYIPIWKK